MEAENIFYFGESTDIDKDRQQMNDALFQEAIRITMEINTQYHTPEEFREIDSSLLFRLKIVKLRPVSYGSSA